MANGMTWTQRVVVSLAVLVGASLMGCVDGGGALETEQASELTADDAELFDAMVGRWQFVYTDEIRASVEQRLADSVEDPAELEAAKADAIAEANASVIELTADRRYVSRIGDEVLMDAKFDTRADGEGALYMTPVENEGPNVRVELRDADTLVMHDPRKGPLTFVRK